MRFHRWLVAPFLAVFLLGCAPGDESISLRCSIAGMSVVVGEKGLITTLEGGFRVEITLGGRASSASDVSFPSFSLVRADQGIAAISKEHLSVVGSEPTPVHLVQGNSTTIHFEIGDQAQPGAPVSAMQISKSDFSGVCSAGLLQIVGTISNAADVSGRATVTSPAFSPQGCPE